MEIYLPVIDFNINFFTIIFLSLLVGFFSGLFGIILLVGLNSLNSLTINDNFFIGQIAVLIGTFSFALASVIIKNAHQ